MVKIPNYADYSLVELYHVLNSIRGDLYPHVFDALQSELLKREPRSVVELEDCYFVLDKQKHPEYAERLLGEIEKLGGFTLLRPFEVTEENKYRTFWRRFWAHFIDGFVVGLPLVVILSVLHGADILRPAAKAYVDQVSQFVVLIYYIAMHANYGQTVGKMATHVKVWDKSESREITLKQSVLRDIVPVLFACISLFYFLGFGVTEDSGELTRTAEIILMGTGIVAMTWWLVEIVTMLFSKKRRALHDLIAGTVVTRIP